MRSLGSCQAGRHTAQTRTGHFLGWDQRSTTAGGRHRARSRFPNEAQYISCFPWRHLFPASPSSCSSSPAAASEYVPPASIPPGPPIQPASASAYAASSSSAPPLPDSPPEPPPAYPDADDEHFDHYGDRGAYDDEYDDNFEQHDDVEQHDDARRRHDADPERRGPETSAWDESFLENHEPYEGFDLPFCEFSIHFRRCAQAAAHT